MGICEVYHPNGVQKYRLNIAWTGEKVKGCGGCGEGGGRKKWAILCRRAYVGGEEGFRGGWKRR